MGQHDWYRNKEWSEDIELAFRARLSRSRDLYNKTQYLRIQASYLLSSSDPTIQNVGLGMMNEVLSDYPDIDDVIVNKFDALVNVGDFFYRREDFETAYINYKKAIGYDKKKTVVQDHAYHGFIKSAVFSKHEEAYPAGLKYLEDARDTILLFLSEIYDHYLASAMLYAAIGRHETAKECASVSLRVLNEESPLHMKDKPVATEREYMFLTKLLD